LAAGVRQPRSAGLRTRRPNGHWQGRHARYRGSRKNLFDLRRIAVVSNLHVIARQHTHDDHQLAA
jgi:hypothetical protein